VHIDSAGFAYNIAFSQQVDAQAIPLLEEKMRELAKNLEAIQILEMMRENAVNLMDHLQQPIKADQVNNSLFNIVQIVKIDDFYDFFPSLDLSELENFTISPSTAIKLLSIEETTSPTEIHENYKTLTLSGTAAENKQALKHQIKLHRHALENHPIQLGFDMQLFTADPHQSPEGLFWCEKGVFLREALQSLWNNNCQERQFKRVITPSIVSPEFQQTWRIDKNIPSIISIDDQESLIIQNKIPFLAHYLSLMPASSYLWPIRLAEWSSSPITSPWWNHPLALSAHTAGYRLIACNEQQIEQEIISCLQFFEKTITILGFRCEWILLTSGKKTSTRSQYDWNQNLDHLKNALASCGYNYREDHSQSYLSGPRVELQVKDLLDRRWTVSTLEIALAYAQQLGIKWQDHPKMAPPFLISEMLFTSLEQVMALLIQTHEGLLPWEFAPEHVRILPIGKQTLAYANKVANRLKEEQFRIGMDLKDEPLAGKIHRAEKEKIPYLLIIGDKEAKENKIAIRPHGQKALKKSLSIEAFIQEMNRKR
jgi:threonyl-tRNA synthetase